MLNNFFPEELSVEVSTANTGEGTSSSRDISGSPIRRSVASHLAKQSVYFSYS